MSDEKLRLGGMALRNGLALFGPTSWAAAVRTRRRRHPRGERPAPALPRRRSRADRARRRADVRDARRAAGRSGARLPEARLSFEHGGVATATVLCAALATVVKRRGGVRGELGSTLIGIVPSLVTLRSRDLVRYHGAEHKTVAGYERGVEAVDDGQGARALRHASRRAAPARRRRARPASPRARRAGCAGPSARSARSRPSASRSSCSRGASGTRRRRGASALGRPGTALQRALATAEPGEAELEVAERALDRAARGGGAGAGA